MMKKQKSRRNQEQLVGGARRSDEGRAELWSMKTWYVEHKEEEEEEREKREKR